MSSAGEIAYEGLSIYGRVRAVIGLVVALIIAIIVFMFGRAGWRDARRSSAPARLVGKPRDCGDVVGNSDRIGVIPGSQKGNQMTTHYVCTDAQFEHNGVLVNVAGLKMPQQAYDKARGAGMLTVYYDPKDPQGTATADAPMSRGIAGAMMGGALLFAAGAAFFTRLTFQSKAFAATTGAVSATHDVLEAF